MRKLTLIIKDDGSALLTDEDNQTIRNDIPAYEIEAFLKGL